MLRCDAPLACTAVPHGRGRPTAGDGCLWWAAGSRALQGEEDTGAAPVLSPPCSGDTGFEGRSILLPAGLGTLCCLLHCPCSPQHPGAPLPFGRQQTLTVSVENVLLLGRGTAKSSNPEGKASLQCFTVTATFIAQLSFVLGLAGISN